MPVAVFPVASPPVAALSAFVGFAPVGVLGGGIPATLGCFFPEGQDFFPGVLVWLIGIFSPLWLSAAFFGLPLPFRLSSVSVLQWSRSSYAAHGSLLFLGSSGGPLGCWRVRIAALKCLSVCASVVRIW